MNYLGKYSDFPPNPNPAPATGDICFPNDKILVMAFTRRLFEYVNFLRASKLSVISLLN